MAGKATIATHLERGIDEEGAIAVREGLPSRFFKPLPEPFI
jgi:hypothetical protein